MLPLPCWRAAAVVLPVCLYCSTLLCGFYPLLHSMLYIILQVRSSHHESLLLVATVGWH
jgi:hypothetical protein